MELYRRKNLKLVVTADQESILIGCLLGDAYITTRGQIQFEQSEKQKEYLFWKHSQLTTISYKNVSCVKRIDKRFNQEYTSYRFWTRQYFQSWRKKFYPKGKKIIPKDILISPLSLAVWYMDDGCLSDNKVIISTDSFTKEDIQFLQEYFLKSFDINTSVRNGSKLLIKKESWEKFFSLIEPYIISSMHYKIFDPVTTSRDFKKPRDAALRHNTSVPDLSVMIKGKGIV